MPVVYCVVRNCMSKRGSGLSFFRCPKDEARCKIWKEQLGFTGCHKFANITPDQCYEKIRICSKHFIDKHFTSPDKHNLTQYAVPTLFLLGPTKPNSSRVPELLNSEVQTDALSLNDACVQTVFNKNDQGCQTLSKLLSTSPREAALKEKIKILMKEISQAKKKLQVGTTLKDVENFFTEHYSGEASAFLKYQISLLNKAPKGCRYSDEFKKYCLSLYFLGPKSYRKLSKVCRLPSKTTLNLFIKSWIIAPGFNDFIFRLIEIRSRLFEEKLKDCIICIDEMSLKSNLYYDISKDNIIGFQEGFNGKSSDIASTALVLMARGIANNWRQPFAYFFYKFPLNLDELKNIIFESIRKLTACGLNVHAVVSDQGLNFYKLVKTSLNLTEENPCFMVDGEEVVYLFDVPKLLNSTRNNLFSYKFIINDGEVNKKFIEHMYHFERQKQFRLSPKLSIDHIFPNKNQKKEVKLAAQLFSHSVAVAMSTYIDFGVLSKDAKPTMDFIQKMNAFFDILNSNTSSELGAFMGTEGQISVLKEMDDMFKNLLVENMNGRNITKQLKFIYSWRLTINSIQILFNKLQAKGHTCMFTRNLNQDCLEHFFGRIRNSCGNVKHPTAIQFSRSFKKMIALKYFDQTDGVNCIADINEVLLNIASSYIIGNVDQDLIFRPTYNPLRVCSTDYRNLRTPEGNSSVYVTSYLLEKCLLQHPCGICCDFSKSITSRDGETTSGGPTRNIIEYVNVLEDTFTSKFEEMVPYENIGNSLKNHLARVTFCHPCKNFPLDYFITLYCRVRIFFTLKFANRNMQTGKASKRNDRKLSILQNL